MKYYYYIIYFLSLFIIFSCQNETTEKINNAVGDKNEIILDSNQAMIYTVPTPIQITSALKMLDITFSEDIIRDTKDNKTTYLSNFSKALNLGINLVDFAYVVMYDKDQTSLIYFNKIENLTKELDLQNQKTIDILKKCRTNLNKKDSLFKTLLTFQNEVDKRLFEIQKEEVSILIISGFYIEGLYMLMNHYDKLMNNKALTTFYSNNLNNIILQQKIYLESLIDLMKMYPSNDFVKLTKSFNTLNIAFENLNIRYEYSDKEKKIKNVSFNTSKINDITKLTRDLRKSIITNTY